MEVNEFKQIINCLQFRGFKVVFHNGKTEILVFYTDNHRDKNGKTVTQPYYYYLTKENINIGEDELKKIRIEVTEDFVKNIKSCDLIGNPPPPLI
jgi:hypothetical protein